MAGDVVIDHYDWTGGREAMLRFGPSVGPVVMVAMPLFEEANRTRSVAVALLRALAARGIAGALPDLPGTGESLIPTEQVTLADWRLAFAAAAGALPGQVHVAAMRGGALVDADAAVASRWYLAPVSGAALLRETRRGRSATAGAGSDDLAGPRLSAALIVGLEGAEPTANGRLRVVRFASDPRPSDRTLNGIAPWRKAEPASDAALASALADDIATWITRCDG